MRIKKYNQYVKESKKNEEFIFGNEDETQSQEESQDEIIDSQEEEPNELSGDIDSHDQIGDEDEEEGHQYTGSKMLAELADKLGSKVINNSVEYNGKKINFFSETEMYHVDRKKFKTADEVVEYLNASSQDEDVIKSDESEEELDYSKTPEIMSESKKSYRTSRTFKSFRK